ncbi:hypothetical protein AB0F72_27765 [Actinoplanes sp. NPDC023936]|uniref:hypothetical protein n=1 Tax=Actinoplanes sp. NPDC023936 TaxID=3154910 RepID=UPI0033F6F822
MSEDDGSLAGEGPVAPRSGATAAPADGGRSAVSMPADGDAEPFSAAMERRVTEAVLGERRHGLPVRR